MTKKLFTYLNNIQDELMKLEMIQHQYTDNKFLVAFRGEGCDYGKTKLMPSLFRNRKYIEREKYLFELLFDYEIIDAKIERNIEKAIEAQHYVAISRMLDITFNVLSAIYFACESDSNISEDGYIYIFSFPEHYSPHSAYVEEFYSNMLEGKDNIAYSKNFKVVSHCYSNDRIKAQSGGFIFFPGYTFFPIDSTYYSYIKISRYDKKDILDELDKLFQVNKATIYPEKDKKAQLIRSKVLNDVYCDKKLSVEEELKTYFNRISYEISMNKKRYDSNKRVDLLRRLRKEESDLITYVEKVNLEKIKENKNSLKEYVTGSFEMLRMSI